MKIAVIVYSLSGHTLRAGRVLEERLVSAGHEVSLERVETVGPARRNNEDAALKTAPSVASCDAVVLCTPVRGGAPPPPMARYLEQIPTLEGMRVACLVTHFLPRRWGADQTLAIMGATCAAKGATVVASGAVKWSSFSRGKQLERVADELAGALS